MNKTWYIILAAAVVIGSFLLFAQESAPNGTSELGMPVPGADTPEATVESEEDISGLVEVPDGITVTPIGIHTIQVTAEGFLPANLTVKRGDSVTWANESGRDTWPASAMHPTHTVYPGSDIQKCGTAEAATMFDSCAAVSSGSSWSFIFNEVGTWKYHDHLRATVFGSVTVE